MVAKDVSPKKGEIWIVNFDPVIGQECMKTRPALVVSEDSIGLLQLKIVVPILGWKDRFIHQPWRIQIKPTKKNGLTKISCADSFQVKSLSEKRFNNRIGLLHPRILEEVLAGIVLCIGFQY